jgi:hypothetical protein
VKEVVPLTGILELKFWRERGSWKILLRAFEWSKFFRNKKRENGALGRT